MKMAKDTVIKVEGLGKVYKIGERERYLALRDNLLNLVKLPYKLITGNAPLKKPQFWALKDVSFEVKKGEVIGVIGRNGAGKTTLLKILSRITEPTTGQVTLKGRVSALLEVGTGFHPELTGRENIYLNGAILGMKKKEITAKFDAIVKFSGVEKFLDTPVKRYSSGMQVRLAFAVAAHLDPEILLIDEVLAVGDAEFQKKCLGKMKDAATSGRTILFVSHNMAAVKNLCTRCVLLKDGKIDDIGETDKIIKKYLEMVETIAELPIARRKDRKGDGKLRITKIYCEDKRGRRISNFFSGQDVRIVAEYESGTKEQLTNVQIAFSVDNKDGVRIFQLWNELTGDSFAKIPNKGKFICYIPDLPLVTGDYVFTIFTTVNNVISDWIINAAKFRVEDGNFYRSGKKQLPGQGDFLIRHKWSIESAKK